VIVQPRREPPLSRRLSYLVATSAQFFEGGRCARFRFPAGEKTTKWLASKSLKNFIASRALSKSAGVVQDQDHADQMKS
jgi:hypothetical protein